MHPELFHDYQSYNVQLMHRVRDATIQRALGSIRILVIIFGSCFVTFYLWDLYVNLSGIKNKGFFLMFGARTSLIVSCK